MIRQEIDQLLSNISRLTMSESRCIEDLLRDLNTVLADDKIRPQVLPKLHDFLRKQIRVKASTERDIVSDKKNSQVTPVTIRNLLFHSRNIPPQYYSYISQYTWLLLENMQSFNNPQELENFLSYSLGKRLQVKAKDKQHIINCYKRHFSKLSEADRLDKLIDIARRVFAESSKVDLESIRDKK